MEIQSAFNSGVNGFRNATELATESSTNIAKLSTNLATENVAQPADEVNLSTQTSITEELVNLRVAEHQAMASAKVITTADEVVGSLIDTRV
jgi:flagellar hook-associated protein FlgK